MLFLPSTGSDIPNKDTEYITLASLLLLLFGTAAISICLSCNQAVGTAFLWAIACLVAGMATGFLFGIPKPGTKDQGMAPGTPEDKGIAGQSCSNIPNTNLSEISDWITKIIVGIGLVQMREIISFLRKLAAALARGLGDENRYFAVALAIIVAFFLIGGLWQYMVTRLFLTGAFSRADVKARAVQESEAEQAVKSSDEARKSFEEAAAQTPKPQTPQTDAGSATETSGQSRSPVPTQTSLDTLKNLEKPISSEQGQSRAKLNVESLAQVNAIATKLDHMGIPREAIAEKATQGDLQSVMAGLASLINASPQGSDANYLISLAKSATTSQARHAIAHAALRLMMSGFLGKAEREAIKSILEQYKKDADEDLSTHLKNIESWMKQHP